MFSIASLLFKSFLKKLLNNFLLNLKFFLLNKT